MKLYHHFAHGWQLPGQQDKRADRVDLPGTAPELCAWLNARRVSPAPGGRTVEPLAIAPAQPARTPEQSPIVAPDAPNDAGAGAAIAAGADQVADWILDTATAAEVERLFACLGARFHEQRKAGA